jgi:hypothetical protein
MPVTLQPCTKTRVIISFAIGKTLRLTNIMTESHIVFLWVAKGSKRNETSEISGRELRSEYEEVRR